MRHLDVSVCVCVEGVQRRRDEQERAARWRACGQDPAARLARRCYDFKTAGLASLSLVTAASTTPLLTEPAFFRSPSPSLLFAHVTTIRPHFYTGTCSTCIVYVYPTAATTC